MKLWCVLIDHEKRLMGGLFSVSRDHGIDVEDLVKKVKEKRFVTLKEVDSRMLTVYKLDGLTTNLKKDELEDHISKIDFSTASELKGGGGGGFRRGGIGHLNARPW